MDPPSQPSLSTGPQIRSRITVVCAECKRLKLKCDRRTPCGSCTKRDTVPRCIYSPAAAEKVDLHSLNNRLIQVESTLALITAGQTPPAFVSSYPFSAPPTSHSSHQHQHHHHLAAAPPTSAQSSLSVSMDDLVSIWLDDLDLAIQIPPPTGLIKLEPSSVELSQPHSMSIESSDSSTDSSSSPPPHASSPTSQLLLPPISIYYPTSLPQKPTPTSALLALLPPSSISAQLLDRAGEAVTARLGFHWNAFRSRCASLLGVSSPYDHGSRESYFGSQSASTSSSSPRESCQDPETISFFAAACAALAIGALLSPHSTPPVPDASFLYALSVQALSIAEGEGVGQDTEDSVDATTDSEGMDYLIGCLLQVLFLLVSSSAENENNSDGKKSAREKARGKARARGPGSIFPLVGKMVNTARALGLARDPDDRDSRLSKVGKSKSRKGGRFSLFESEMRRRIWHDVVFFDLFTSDSMSQPPLIPINSYTTKLPASDVDDSAFSPSSTSVPRLPYFEEEQCDELEDEHHAVRYFGARYRLIQLIRATKQRITSPDCCCGYTLDQASTLEAEVRTWLGDLPRCLQLDLHAPLPTPSSLDSRNNKHAEIAQRCEFSIIANKLITKIWIPFLRPPPAASSNSSPGLSSGSGSGQGPGQAPWAPPHQAVFATVNAAQGIIRASRELHALGKTHAGVPVMLDFYVFEKTILDAVVVGAHAAIVGRSMGSGVGPGVTEDVGSGLDILMELVAAGEKGSDIGRIGEAIRRRLESCREGGGHGVKRKRDDQGDKESGGLELPYVGANGMTSTSASTASLQSSSEMVPSQTRKDPPRLLLVPKTNATGEKEKKHAKKGHGYPPVGIRVRPGKDQSLLVKQRAGASGNLNGSANGETRGVVHSASLLGSNARTTTGEVMQSYTQSQPQQQVQMQNSPVIADYRSRSSSSVNQDPRLHQQDSASSQSIEFAMPFGGSEQSQMDLHALQRRRFSVQELGQQQPFVSTPPIYDTNQPRADSYDTSRGYDQSQESFENGHAQPDLYAANSPYANSASSLSNASSPYTSTGAHPQTPTFGPVPTMSSHHPSPPTFGQATLASASSPQYYIGNGYGDAYESSTGNGHGHGGLGMEAHGSTTNGNGNGGQLMSSVVATPLYEKHQAGYDVKPTMEGLVQQQHHQRHAQHSYQLASDLEAHHVQSQAHSMSMGGTPAWSAASQQQQQGQVISEQSGQYWASATEFKFYQ